MDRLYDVAQLVARRAAAFTLATCLVVLGTFAPGASSLAISWSEPTPHVDAFLVQYRPSGSTGAGQWAKLPDPTRAYTMSGLSGATAYDVTVQFCQAGIDDCTAQATLTASTTGAPPTPASVALGQVAATTAQLEWTDTDPGMAHYAVTLGQPTGGSCTVMQTVTLSATTHAYTLSNLQPLTAYCGWVSATNGVGTVGSWPWFTFTTPAS